MTTYQLVPYLVHVSVKGKPGETRPLDDLFGGGEQLVDELANMLAGHLGVVVQDPTPKSYLRIRVESVGKGVRQLNAIVSPGKSGVVSKIRRRTGREINRDFNDIELTPLRHFMIYPANGHRAVLFAERVGGNGAVTALSKLMTSMWDSKHQTTRLHIESAMSEAAMDGALANRPISKIRLVRSKGANGNLAVGANDVEYVLEIRPRHRGANWIKSAFPGNKGLSDAILREVAPVLLPGKSKKAAAKVLADDGWQVAVELRLEGGTKRTVFVDDKSSISMSFPIIEGESAPAERPDDSEVLSAVQGILADGLASPWGLEASSAQMCAWSDEPWLDTSGWKVQWHVLDEPAPRSSGAISSED